MGLMRAKRPEKLGMLRLLALLLLYYGVGDIHCTTVHESSVDLQALLDFKQGITSDPNGALSNWSRSTHFCRWNGVNCSVTRPVRVTKLNLTGESLAGQITASLGNLTFLKTLDLSNNNFFGPVPLLKNLRLLSILYLNNNYLQGTIPVAIMNCSSLSKLSLSTNLLTGVIPSNIDSLSSLSYLGLLNNNLMGVIPPYLGNLTFLNTLDLSNNSLRGPIPLLKNLRHLEYFYLNENSLRGNIPDAIMNLSSLIELDLSKNLLTGGIPSNIDTLSSLSYLNLMENNLTSIIPPSLGNITTLEGIYLAVNELEGTLPEMLWQLPKISALLLGQNRLSGGIPQTLYNQSSLVNLGLEFNNLGNTLPPNVGYVFRNLQDLTMSHNMFQGQIPVSLGNASQLVTIDLATNSFTGQVPTSFRELHSLNYLNLQDNYLEAEDGESWKFLDALGNCTSVQTLSLANNELQGVIPDSIGNLPNTSLQYLLLGGNNLSGIVPPSIGNLHGLTWLSLNSNNLTGPIDDWIGKLKNLVELNLAENRFIGVIPSSISNLIGLTKLNLGANGFSGIIPLSLGKLPHLQVLNLSSNNFHGTIALEFSNLKQLTEIHLSSNRLTWKIPDTLDQCENLVTINLDRNLLTGKIPISLGNLKGLITLNLSHNNLSGTIPASLNDLTLLTKIDLSYNHLEGEIPRNGVFENATVVSLDGNWGLCGGVIDLEMPLCTTVSPKRQRNYNLVRILIPVFGFMSLLMLTYVVLLGKKSSRRAYILLLSFGRHFPRVSYKDLAQATRNFSESNLIGRGSYGSVYRGKLTQAKIQVAIKVFHLQVRSADKSFVSECEVLRSIRHRNLLPILTACSTIDDSGNDFKALVYEFMPNGNLDMWLHNFFADAASNKLSLAQRVSIGVDIANALSYLHHDCETSIVHCDLKPTNILLDNDMNAYLGDFGISSLVLDSSPNSSVELKGTIGYIAPEYAQSVQTTTCGDVYSFGVVLLEMLISKRPTDSMFENELNIVKFVEKNFPDRISHIIDAPLQEEYKGLIAEGMVETENEFCTCLLSVFQVALSCTCQIPRERMNMRDVSMKMYAIRTSYAEAIKRKQNIFRSSDLKCVMEVL